MFWPLVRSEFCLTCLITYWQNSYQTKGQKSVHLKIPLHSYYRASHSRTHISSSWIVNITVGPFIHPTPPGKETDTCVYSRFYSLRQAGRRAHTHTHTHTHHYYTCLLAAMSQPWENGWSWTNRGVQTHTNTHTHTHVCKYTHADHQHLNKQAREWQQHTPSSSHYQPAQWAQVQTDTHTQNQEGYSVNTQREFHSTINWNNRPLSYSTHTNLHAFLQINI